MNSIKTPTLSKRVELILTKQFEMKLLDKTSNCFGLQISHLAYGSMLLHEQIHARKLLKTFNMENTNAILSTMIGWSKTDDDPYSPSESTEYELDKLKYLAAVGALLYLATNTRFDISFARIANAPQHGTCKTSSIYSITLE